MAARLWSRVASSSRLRSSERPAGIADHARGPAGHRDGAVAGLLEPAQQQQGHQVADVQAVGGGIEAGVERDRALGQPPTQLVGVGAVRHQLSGGQVVQDGVAHLVTFAPRDRTGQLVSPAGPRLAVRVARRSHWRSHGRLRPRVRRSTRPVRPGGRAPRRRRRRFSPARIAVIATCAFILGMWILVYVWSAVQPTPDKLSSPAFAQQAEPICKTTAGQLAALPPAQQSPDNVARADVVDQTNRDLRTMLTRLAAIAPSGKDGRIVSRVAERLPHLRGQP